MKKTVGFIGWRGMVGSVLLKRMLEENDFDKFNFIFFSTSQVGVKNPSLNKEISKGFLKDAYNLDELRELDIIITCQGSFYTNKIYSLLRSSGWMGYWIDAASDLRMKKSSLIVLDPINYKNIKKSLENGVKTFIGGNCTVSLMMLALGGLFRNDLIEWISFSTYQAASGGGSGYIMDLLKQISFLNKYLSKNLNLSTSILKIEKKITKITKNKNFPQRSSLAPLILNLIPWIDSKMQNGQSREEWKMEKETNKILSRKKSQEIKIDGTCVRVGSLRCHSQSFLIKLKKNIDLKSIEEVISHDNEWVSVVPNEKYESLHRLTPLSVSGTLKIPIGRLRKSSIGDKYLSAFSIGDQLLWGAAEPLRRVLRFLL
ncbi:aspartate-semialdehyde dehydrogenase [Buchnera aphidicola]|uniref:aspartate-semialdehyde dehydrogenase n=1 Tax=Buchnera aphidicola TaxID=9 RepID=UPI002093C4EF|nr:aspartate-semialdehyde dehydrogenase [Buchnera aphidicola]USS94027.1 aspartate-semialdehyde dehydrogenase [Buchnera aphidicola (Sipha maydis)]WII23571.1 aspartate-semialdehyde dehydrogenase [Buchnera aphidicola (Sipha maydis)]